MNRYKQIRLFSVRGDCLRHPDWRPALAADDSTPQTAVVPAQPDAKELQQLVAPVRALAGSMWQ